MVLREMMNSKQLIKTLIQRRHLFNVRCYYLIPVAINKPTRKQTCVHGGSKIERGRVLADQFLDSVIYNLYILRQAT